MGTVSGSTVKATTAFTALGVWGPTEIKMPGSVPSERRRFRELELFTVVAICDPVMDNQAAVKKIGGSPVTVIVLSGRFGGRS